MRMIYIDLKYNFFVSVFTDVLGVEVYRKILECRTHTFEFCGPTCPFFRQEHRLDKGKVIYKCKTTDGSIHYLGQAMECRLLLVNRG